MLAYLRVSKQSIKVINQSFTIFSQTLFKMHAFVLSVRSMKNCFRIYPPISLNMNRKRSNDAYYNIP